MSGNLINGVKKIRRTFARSSDQAQAVKEMIRAKDKDIKAVLKAYDSKPAELLDEIKGLEGATTDESLKLLGLKQSDGEEDEIEDEYDEIFEDQSDGNSDEVELEIVMPDSVTCPEKDAQGRKTSMVMTDSGMVACAVPILKGQSSDASKNKKRKRNKLRK